MRPFLLLLPVLLAHAAAASTIVNMQLLNSPGEPEIYNFDVNGSQVQLFCDDAFHGIVTTPYQATETTLSDLSGTLLERNGDPQALADYEDIAILELQALADPSLVRDVVIANWSITAGRQARDTGAAALISWVQTQNPANYDLSGFVIFTSNTVQEQTGFVPEPVTWLLAGTSLSLLALVRRRNQSSRVARFVSDSPAKATEDYRTARRTRRLLLTTVTLESAMAAEASMGDSNPNAATGIPSVL
jgi:hypothetical protein